MFLSPWPHRVDGGFAFLAAFGFPFGCAALLRVANCYPTASADSEPARLLAHAARVTGMIFFSPFPLLDARLATDPAREATPARSRPCLDFPAQGILPVPHRHRQPRQRIILVPC